MTLSTEALNCETILPTSVSVTERMRSSFFYVFPKRTIHSSHYFPARSHPPGSISFDHLNPNSLCLVFAGQSIGGGIQRFSVIEEVLGTRRGKKNNLSRHL